MPKHRYNFRYTVGLPLGEPMIEVFNRDGSLRRMTSFVQARTMRAALRKARGMGPGAEIERVYLHGKHKGLARIWTIL